MSARDWGYPRYVSVAEKKATAAKKLQQLVKQNPGIRPVVLQGQTLARTWWGKGWNKNLERYADYTNRIGRGRSYLRHGAVLDLKIEAGLVTALVQGSRTKPYEVRIRIKPLAKTNWEAIRKQCAGKLASLPDLLTGKFSKEMGEIFLSEGKGLFPTPKEIAFDCSCPDWALMCKHVAAALYGIGARLDEEPALFFTLRRVDTEELVARAVRDNAGELLARSKKKSARVIDAADLSNIFGIDLDQPPEFAAKPGIAAAPRPVAGKTARPAGGKKQPPPPEKPVKTDTELVMEIIGENRTGTTVAMLEEQTGFSRAKIYGITSRLRRQDRIAYVAQGIYAGI